MGDGENFKIPCYMYFKSTLFSLLKWSELVLRPLQRHFFV